MATGGIGMTAEQDFLRRLTETAKERQDRRRRQLEALERAGLLTFFEMRELTQMRRTRVLERVDELEKVDPGGPSCTCS